MRILQINSVYGIKSTGRIAYDLVEIQNENGIEGFAACSSTDIKADNVFSMSRGPLWDKLNILKTRLFGRHGFYNKAETKGLCSYMDKIKPDIIHLHNIHGHYINIEMLFRYINKHNIPVVWTLHDCWAFTGHCPHFDYAGCDKWKTGCHHCTLKRGYPCSWFFDRSKKNYADKKRIFTSVDRMHIVTPSGWLAELAKESFLGKYPVSVVHNGIDTEVFKFTASDIRKELSLEDKFVILGIVSNLNSTKGGQYFLELSKMLKEDEHILLVSLEEGYEKLPKNITAVGRTENARELAKYYSLADVFVNPTLQDTFSMINLESLACSTPVVTFNTGGCTESLTKDCGAVAEKGSTKALYEGISRVRNKEFRREDCRARGLDFSREKKFLQYIDIYKAL
ncbi:MAG: glycosyltransferase [Ruminococcus sp.]|nr:glycosyltransferase [Oscillospiraceae bacterium]MBR2724944.1 glycosyltransferase [Ruminococcus sp.]MBR6646655.1 glycosyltransferase [Clostridia bacterium]